MIEERSEYRKKQEKKRRHEKRAKLLELVRASFSNQDPEQSDLDVNPDFLSNSSTPEQVTPVQEPTQMSDDFGRKQALKLKKRLNIAILVVSVLIALVLFALFKL